MDEAAIRGQFEGLMVLREHCQRADASGDLVQKFLNLTLLFVKDLMSEEVFARAMRSGESGEGLLLLANRFAQLSPLIGQGWPDDFNFDDIVRELFAIANGDAPKLFKRPALRGQFLHAHTLLELKLEAHVWYKVLGNLGVKTNVRNEYLENFFYVSKDAFNKWRKEAKDKLGVDYVERFLVTAVGQKLLESRCQEEPIEWATGQIARAGASYRRALRGG